MKQQAEGVGGREEEEREKNLEGKLKEGVKEGKDGNWEERRLSEGNWEGRRYSEGNLREEEEEGGKELRCSQCGRRKEKTIFLRKPLPTEEKTFGDPGRGGIGKGSSAIMMMPADKMQNGKVGQHKGGQVDKLQQGGQVEKQERRKKESPGSSDNPAEKRQVCVFTPEHVAFGKYTFEPHTMFR